jgi:beta-galactosidase
MGQDVMGTAGPARNCCRLPTLDDWRGRQRPSFITVTVADAKGILVPRSKNRLTFEVSGQEIVAVDNGDATSHESFSRRTQRL